MREGRLREPEVVSFQVVVQGWSDDDDDDPVAVGVGGDGLLLQPRVVPYPKKFYPVLMLLSLKL
jgi:hypothetical protein